MEGLVLQIKKLVWLLPGGFVLFRLDPLDAFFLVLIVGLLLAILLAIVCLALIWVPPSAAKGIRRAEEILTVPRKRR